MILVILKYLGLFLAAASSIWGTTHELTYKTADNRKHLTKAGMVSILFVITGLVLSVISDDIGRKNAAKEQSAKVAAEAKRTNEITIASQPLTSLNFVLQFESSDKNFRKKMEEGDQEIEENNWSTQGGVPSVPYEAMEYEVSLIPMLRFLGEFKDDENNDGAESKGIYALIPLDGSPNSILSFGNIFSQVSWSTNDSVAVSPSLNKGIQSVITTPYTTKKYLTNGPSKYTINWNLDPITLEKSVNRANPGIRPGAKLPRVLSIVVLNISEMLPFAYDNFALTTATNLWTREKPKKNNLKTSKMSNVTLSVQVNGFSELIYSYKLAKIYPKTLYDDWGEEIEIECTVLEFRLEQ